MAQPRRDQVPEGIAESHERPLAGWRRHASPLSVLVFGAVVLLGMSGVLGHERDWTAEADGTHLHVHAPEVIRNGEFLEMRIRVTSERPIQEFVVGIEATLWEDMTVNTMIPAATDEESSDGEFRFTFAPMEAGGEFLLKLDLQVNPDIVSGNDGVVSVHDGEERLVSVDLSMAVLP